MPNALFAGPLAMMFLGLQLFLSVGHTKVMSHVCHPAPKLSLPQPSAGTAQHSWTWPWL